MADHAGPHRGVPVTTAGADGPRLGDYAPRSRLRVPVTRVERASVPAVDAHAHLGRWLTGDWAVRDPRALLATMDRCNIRAVVNLDGRWGAELRDNLDRYDRAFPGRFVTFCHADWSRLRTAPGERAGALLADDLEAAVAAGARGLKVWKDLGLSVRDGAGRLVLPDDARLWPLWRRAGELGVPVAVHTADPMAFFDPPDVSNERLEELLEHPEWSYAGKGLPTFERLIAALENVIRAHPGTTFIGVHAGCCAEDLSVVDRMLATCPNYRIDISARLAELGRQPRRTRALLLRHRGRVLFGTDEIPPREAAYRMHFRFLETEDEHFPHTEEHPPLRGRWMISGLGLPPDVLEEIYAGTARHVIPGL
ncbi:amidohydrolase family protein [Streptomyces sp. NPDC052012]|uniref:amidohydrolase family protein n=1 Tax=Streptomyces sp. NPDC052012 TaxID=3155051 RepID=UPI00344EA342